MHANKQRLYPHGAVRWTSRLIQLAAESNPEEPGVPTRPSTSVSTSTGRDPRCAGAPSHQPSGKVDKDTMPIGMSVRIVACVLLVLTSWWLVACGSSASPSSSATVSPIAAATSTAPAASPPPGGPAPAQLIGTWTRVVTAADSAAVVTITTSGFQVADKLGGGSGDLVVNGNEIDFFNVLQCGLVLPHGVGRYQWRLRGTTLHFVPLNHDPCPVRHRHFANQDFSRSGG